jgi:hypothetical protein
VIDLIQEFLSHHGSIYEILRKIEEKNRGEKKSKAIKKLIALIYYQVNMLSQKTQHELQLITGTSIKN